MEIKKGMTIEERSRLFEEEKYSLMLGPDFFEDSGISFRKNTFISEWLFAIDEIPAYNTFKEGYFLKKKDIFSKFRRNGSKLLGEVLGIEVDTENIFNPFLIYSPFELTEDKNKIKEYHSNKRIPIKANTSSQQGESEKADKDWLRFIVNPDYERDDSNRTLDCYLSLPDRYFLEKPNLPQNSGK